jgi:rubrerythrin
MEDFMSETINDIEWEIEQINTAINYYESASRNSKNREEKRKYEKQIRVLRNKVKELSRLI